MNIYKKIFFFFLCVSISVEIFPQLNIGIKGGLNVSSIDEYHTPDGNLHNLDSRVSFHAGLLFQYMFNNSFGLESGLYYSMLGGKEEKDADNIRYTTTANPSYLQLPLLAIYKFEIQDGFYLYPSGGVYFGYGLGGKIRTKSSFAGTTKEDFFHHNIRRFDVGVSIGVNAEYQNFILSLGLDQGLLRMNKKMDFYEKNGYNQNFKISLGYILEY
ncbi:MAG: PorT family protein [Candidatus Azobacteroides sp.]|nr:PorT family protein [Candidatus Azobacteroides sp.]